MRRRVYISSDYSENKGDREVVDIINWWGRDEKRLVDFIDMAQVVSGSVSRDSDCRPCDLKAEFNRQINASSAAIFVIGDNTAKRTAGSSCRRNENGIINCSCTPYKQNSNGSKSCKVLETVPATENVGNINNYSYLRHEFEQAKLRNKKIIIVYNSLYKQSTWLPEYMKEYESIAHPFWIRDQWGNRVGNYRLIKEELGYV